jgi:hypothetical protein
MRTWAGMCAVLVIIAVAFTGCIGVKTQPVPRPETPSLFVD